MRRRSGIRQPLRALALVVAISAGAAQAEPVPVPEAPGELPDALPPLDDDLLDLLQDEPAAPGLSEALRDVTLLGEGRARLELGQRSLFEPPTGTHEGVALTGRIGLEAPVGAARARVVLGGGGHFGPDLASAPLPLVTPGPVSLLRVVSLSFDLPALGLPLRAELGRFPVQIADGRLVGVEAFDPLGRSLDGALLSYAAGDLVVRGGAFYLGPYLESDDALDASGLAFLESAYRLSFWRGTAYAILHRDATRAEELAGSTFPPVNTGTLGLRTAVEGFGLSFAFGVDGQLPFLDSAPLDPAGWGLHLEGAARYAPALDLLVVKGAPFVELSAEWTGGEPVPHPIPQRSLLEPRFRLPAPSLHPFLGVLDLVAPDNTMSGAVAVGFTTPEGLFALVETRLIALAEPKGLLFGVKGDLHPHVPSEVASQSGLNLAGVSDEPLAFTEVDARLVVPLTAGARLEAEYGIAFPGPAFGPDAQGLFQRLLLGVSFTLDAAAER